MLYLLPSPIGNLSDVTLHTLHILHKADVVLCEDTRVTQKLLTLLEQNGSLIRKERRFFAFHSHNQNSFLANISVSFFESCVVFMSDAGMPCVSDPGSLLVQYAQRNEIAYEVVAGGSAVTLAHAYSGFGDGGFVFDGFLPHKSIERQNKLTFWHEVLGEREISLIVFESPYRLLESLKDLCSIDWECRVFAIKEMTKKFEASFRGKPHEILHKLEGEKILGEWVLVLRFSEKKQEKKLGFLDVWHADLPPKIKSKLLSKISDRNPKEWYQEIIGEKL